MPEPVDFAAKVAEKAAAARVREAEIKQDGGLWSVEDMLKDALVVAATERKIVKGVFVYLFEVPSMTGGAPAFKVGCSQAGMGRAEEIGFLELAKQEALDDWRTP